jgi:hypothetical protein
MSELRYLFVEGGEIRDSETGRSHDGLTESLLLNFGVGGVIAGRNMYPLLAAFSNGARKADVGWTGKINVQRQRVREERVKGMMYFSYLSYRFPKIKHRRASTIKWLVLNLELFTESKDVEQAARALVELSQERGIRPRHSPGAMGGAMLRASGAWKVGRSPAPHFISSTAREFLPGNYYARRSGYRRVDRAFYLDQKSAHHTVAATIPLPDPEHIHARGAFFAADRDRVWLPSVDKLDKHIGAILCRVNCPQLKPDETHLFPQWARTSGSHLRWIWTPELRLLDARMTLEYVCAAITAAGHKDEALREYALWSLGYLGGSPHPIVKPALLAAYGMLAVRSGEEVSSYSVHGREPGKRNERVRLPLIDLVWRSTVEKTRVSAIQNVAARGVIEAEVRTRSIELARSFECMGIRVVHIYADGIIVEGTNVPILPGGWQLSGHLTGVSSPAPHSVVSQEMVRTPGIPNGRRSAYIRACNSSVAVL